MKHLQNYAKVTKLEYRKHPVLKHRIIAGCALVCGLSAALPASADDTSLACRNTLSTELANAADATVLEVLDESTVELSAGEFEAQFGTSPTASATGGVVLRRGDKLAGADTARYDPDQRALLLEGDVRYEDPGTQIVSDAAEFSYDSGRIVFAGAEFTLGSSNARGTADNLLINEQGELKLDDVSYTTCPPGDPDWELLAGDIDLDTREGVGTARNIKLRFKNNKGHKHPSRVKKAFQHQITLQV